MPGRKTIPFLSTIAGLTVVLAMYLGGSAACTDWMHKSTVSVGTTSPQTAFNVSLIALNTLHYTFADVQPGSGTIQTGPMDVGHGHWYSLSLRVLATGEVQIDPVTDLERATGEGVMVPEGIVERAATVAKLIRKLVVKKSEDQIASEGAVLLESIMAGMAATGSAAVVAPVPPSGE